MKYRQWKKNYKKKHGVNPPLELDKRKKRRLARKMARQINKTLPTAAETLTAAINNWVQSIKPALATFCENVAAAFSNVAAGESQRTGSKVYYTEVVANSVGFGESKAEAEARGQQLPESDGFMNIPEGADEELPFN